MKGLSMLCLTVLAVAMGCSDKKEAATETSAAPAVAVTTPALEVATSKQWEVNIDGRGPHGAETLLRQYGAGKLTIMGTGGPGGSGIILVIPMATPNETGTFTQGVKLRLQKVPDIGTCKHVDGLASSTASVDITKNTEAEFAATFTMKDFTCQKDLKISGTGSVSQKN